MQRINNIINRIYQRFIPNKLRSPVSKFIQLATNEKKRQKLLYFKILNYFDHNSSEEYRNELEYLKKIGTLAIFPYNPANKDPDNIRVGAE